MNRNDLSFTASWPGWGIGQTLDVPLKDKTGSVIGRVTKESGESSCSVTVTEPEAIESLRQSFSGEDLRSISMGYQVKPRDDE
jgi:hypothetical protein